MIFFEIVKKDRKSQARTGIIHTPHGEVKTPAYTPIGTKGSVKAVTAEELKFWGTEMLLANTYHLWLRPGDALIHKAGGLHKFTGWEGPIMTDSGGFQVFSLGEKQNNSQVVPQDSHLPGPILQKITRAGVEFRDELGGRTHLLTSEASIQIQSNLGSDIALVLDDVPGLPATEERISKSLALTVHWAQRAKEHFEQVRRHSLNPRQRLFGVVQGGEYERLRQDSVRALRAIGFDGYGIGGLAVGEDEQTMYRVVGFTVPLLEEDKPRHLLGVGYPEQIIKSVSLGVDSVDCVIPTRNARHGQLFVNRKHGGYHTLNITNRQFEEDFAPVDNTCGCYGCLHHNRAYLRHLFLTREPLGIRLATMHNLKFYLELMERIRHAIEFDSFRDLVDNYKRHEQ